jgi:hypothetical protein
LVAIKQLEPPEAVLLLDHSSVLQSLAVEERQPLLEQLAENTSFFFEHPDLDPDGDLADKYLIDLAALNARTAPRTAGIEDSLDDVAAFLRRQPKKMQTLVEQHYAAALFDRLPSDVTQRRVSAAAARAALDLLVDSTERAHFLYGPAKLEWPEGSRMLEVGHGSLWLLGVDRRLLLFSVGHQPRVVWRGSSSDVWAEPVRQLLTTSCRLTGGQWQLADGMLPLAMRLPAGLVASYGVYFRPLLSFLAHPESAAG